MGQAYYWECFISQYKPIVGYYKFFPVCIKLHFTLELIHCSHETITPLSDATICLLYSLYVYSDLGPELDGRWLLLHNNVKGGIEGDYI